jgi:hypothetical protein
LFYEKSFDLCRRWSSRLLSSWAVKPLLDTRPLKKILQENVDFKALKKSKTQIIITAVNMLTGHPAFFTQKEIQLEHLLKK